MLDSNTPGTDSRGKNNKTPSYVEKCFAFELWLAKFVVLIYAPRVKGSSNILEIQINRFNIFFPICKIK